MEKSTNFWDRIAERYSKKPVADEAVYQEKLRITREYFQPHMEVLEFGCGTGSTAIAHAPHVKHIQAIDSSSKMIEIARGRASAENIGNVNFTRSTMDDFNVADESLDAVLGLSILHLLDNWEDVIARVYKMLKPGGVFASSTACIAEMMRIFRIILPIGNFLGLMPKVLIFTTKELKDSLTHAGFEIERQWQPGKGKAVFIVARKGLE